MMTVRRLVDEVLAGPVTLEYWKGEVEELRVELVARNWGGVREEWSDVVCLGLAHLHARGWPVSWVPILPGLGLYAMKKFEARLAVWHRIFAHYDVEYRREYLIGGGNYAKVKKVRAALRLAGVDFIVDETWLFEQGICVLQIEDGGAMRAALAETMNQMEYFPRPHGKYPDPFKKKGEVPRG